MKDKKNDRALWIRGTLLARRKEMKLSLRAATARINEFLPEGGAMERLDSDDIALVKSLIDRLSRPPFEESSTGG